VAAGAVEEAGAADVAADAEGVAAGVHEVKRKVNKTITGNATIKKRLILNSFSVFLPDRVTIYFKLHYNLLFLRDWIRAPMC